MGGDKREWLIVVGEKEQRTTYFLSPPYSTSPFLPSQGPQVPYGTNLVVRPFDEPQDGVTYNGAYTRTHTHAHREILSTQTEHILSIHTKHNLFPPISISFSYT